MTKTFMSMAEKRRFEHSQKEIAKVKNQRRTARREWTDDEIRNEFDSNLNMTIDELVILTGKPRAEIKTILMV